MGKRTSSVESVGGLMGGINLDFYRGKRGFVTGHTGFKGSWLCKILTMAGAEATGYSLPAPTEPSLFAISGVEIDEAIAKTCQWTRVWLDGGDVAEEMKREIEAYCINERT